MLIISSYTPVSKVETPKMIHQSTYSKNTVDSHVYSKIFSILVAATPMVIQVQYMYLLANPKNHENKFNIHV